MDSGFLKEWLGLFALLISLGGTVYAWLTSKSKVNAEHLKNVDGLLADHQSRLQRVESEIEHLPPKDDVIELKISIAELKGTIGRLDEGMSGVSRTVRRMEDYLMKDKP